MPRRAIPPRPDDAWALLSWPYARWDTLELLSVALMPFGLVYFSEVVVFGLFGAFQDWATVLVTLVQQVALGATVALWVRRRYGSIAPLGLRRRRWKGTDVGAGVAMGVGCVVAGVATIQLTYAIVERITGSAPAPRDPITQFGPSWETAAVAMALLMAPVCEEILFRGFVFGGLRRRMRFRWAALLSAIPFAALHADPIRLIGLTVIGVMLAGIYERRKTLVASMAAHATVNAVAVIAWLATRDLRP